jgi:HD-like signal output (HDOD) protein
MGKIILTEPALAARLLKIANSAYYSLNAKLDTVSRAITVIGINELKDLVLATSVTNTFGKDLDNIIDMSKFWEHSVACGAYAKTIASTFTDKNCERFFIMGLLHDIGMLIMFSQIPKKMKQIIESAICNKQPICKEERKFLGFDHAEAGAGLLKIWNLPKEQQTAVLNHHRPSKSFENKLETNIIHIADIMASAMNHQNAFAEMVPLFNQTSWEELNISLASLSYIVGAAEAQIEELINTFLPQNS